MAMFGVRSAMIARVGALVGCMTAAIGCDGGAAEEADPAADAGDASEVTPGKGDSAFDPANVATFTGVLPDSATVRGVQVHNLLDELAPDFDRTLRDALGTRLVASGTGYEGPSGGYSRDTSVVWTRDYTPIVVGTPEGKVVVSYLSVNPTRSGYTGSNWIPVTPPSPAHQWYPHPGATGGEWRRTESLPLLHENGNLVATGRWLFASDRLIRLNTAASEGSDAAHLRTAGWKPRSREAVLDLLASATRTPRDRIVVLPSMPGEKTDHIDLVILALAADEVMVPEVREDVLGIITYGHEIELGWRVREYLDDVATTLTDLGVTVHRLPMLPPLYLEADSGAPTGYHGTFFSPANALQAHFAGERARVWLPTFEPVGFPDAYRALASDYVATWVAFFEARDAVVTTLDATALGRAYGLFRCVTAPLF